MQILDIPFVLLSAHPAPPPEPSEIPALPYGELESLLNSRSPSASIFSTSAFPRHNQNLPRSGSNPNPAALNEAETDSNGCQYQTSDGRPCPRPLVHFSDQEQPEPYCSAHFTWLEQVENKLDIPYPESPQALLEVLAHTAARVLTHSITNSQALIIAKLARAIERQLR